MSAGPGDDVLRDHAGASPGSIDGGDGLDVCTAAAEKVICEVDG